jgi:hypothetical protein
MITFYVIVTTDWYGDMYQEYVGGVYDTLPKAEECFSNEARAAKEALAESPREEWGGHQLSKIETTMYSCLAPSSWGWREVSTAWSNPGYYAPEEEAITSIEIENYVCF